MVYYRYFTSIEIGLLIMLNQIKLFFDEHIKLPAPEEFSEEKLQIASAALLLEMMTWMMQSRL